MAGCSSVVCSDGCDVTGVQSVGRAFALLEALGTEPSSLTALAKRVDLPLSTTSRLLGTLEDLGAIERLDDNVYRIGPSILQLASGLDRATRLQTLAQEELDRLARRAEEAAGLSVPVGKQMHFVAQVASSQPVQVQDWVGARLPMHLVAAGILALAYESEEFLNDYLSVDLVASTPNSVIDPVEIQLRLEAAHRDGFAWTWEEFEPDINSVAAPILAEDGKLVGALHLHGPASRFPGICRQEFEYDIVRSARWLGRAIRGVQ